MGKQKLKGKDLRKIGYRYDKEKSLAINIMAQYYKHLNKTEKLELLQNLMENPNKYYEDENLGILAEEFMEIVEKETFKSHKLKEKPTGYSVFGKKFIDQNTINQMDQVMRLPIAEKGALMPDAHVGYGMPIGGVLATKNEIVPYAVGLDIGCRMALTIFDAPIEFLTKYRHKLKESIQLHTYFGTVKRSMEPYNHEILERQEFKEIGLLKQLHGKARNQLGTSGSGNHFVEYGEVVIDEGNRWNIPKGNYLGLLTHSGSRGLGATIAGYYTKVAADVCKLPRSAKQLAWLDMDKSEGMEYWLSMNLAGDYAKACHDVIHQKLAKTIGLKPLAKIENHHNFAWKETQEDGSELIVHRKGSTPAKDGELGIIPASMVHPGYIVSGKGKPNSLCSASHGSGRKMSRTKSKNSFTKSFIKKQLKEHGVTLIGGGTDEAPNAYKNIDDVMGAQESLVKVEGMFHPKIVRMDKD
ncbi:MAG: RtcB family protein [Crocinitomicaceae bacterium]|nr:RtcB family protein [Crocinitomicaceae bacterium]